MPQDDRKGMTLIVKTVTRLTVGLILIYGIYIVLQGHLSAGGGFAGGIIVALSFIHLMLAYGKEAVIKKLNETRGLLLAGVGAIAFLSFATLGFMRGGRVIESSVGFELFSAGFIPLYEIALAMLVGTGVFIVFLALISLIGERSE